MARKFYGSANSQTEQIEELYGSANEQTTRLTKLYGPVNNETKLIHQGFGHVDYRILTAVNGRIAPWVGDGPRISSFDNDVFLAKLASDFPQFLSYSYYNAPVFSLKLTATDNSYPARCDIILQFGDYNSITSEETLASNVVESVLNQFGMVRTGSGSVGTSSYIYLRPTYT